MTATTNPMTAAIGRDVAAEILDADADLGRWEPTAQLVARATRRLHDLVDAGVLPAAELEPARDVAWATLSNA